LAESIVIFTTNLDAVFITTKEVPAVMSGVIEEGLILEDVLRLKGVNN
jgi:hypothetical protein